MGNPIWKGDIDGVTFVGTMDEFLDAIMAPDKGISFRHPDREMFKSQFEGYLLNVLMGYHLGMNADEIMSLVSEKAQNFIDIMEGKRAFNG